LSAEHDCTRLSLRGGHSEARQARNRFVTDDFDGTGRQNAPKSGQIASLWKRQQKAFRPSRDVTSE
jgi:hypothetical protein